jgi:hypothetical protein
VYALQRPYLNHVTGSTPLFLVNGNHEEAGKVLLNGTATSPPVLAGIARTKYYSLPAPPHVSVATNCSPNSVPDNASSRSPVPIFARLSTD